MNLVLRIEGDLRANNYILHPAPNNNFWANISGGRIRDYVNNFRDDFSVVLVGSHEDQSKVTVMVPDRTTS